MSMRVDAAREDQTVASLDLFPARTEADAECRNTLSGYSHIGLEDVARGRNGAATNDEIEERFAHGHSPAFEQNGFSSEYLPLPCNDLQGKLAPKGRTSFRSVPNGIPGVAADPVLGGAVKGHIDPNGFVALTATNHAKT